MRSVSSFLSTLLLFVGQACGQSLTTDAPTSTHSQPLAVETEPEKAWSFSASVYTYFVPDDRDYAQPTVTFDHDWLHLQARYNYEDLESGSVWLGYNFGGGEKLAWELTPMLGGVFGNTTGVAPGCKGSLSWWKLELYSEGEYVFDTGNSSDSFFYNWSELTLSPAEWFRFGLVTQHMRVYQGDRDIQCGPLVGFSLRQLDLAAYVLNLDDRQPTVIVAVALNF